MGIIDDIVKMHEQNGKEVRETIMKYSISRPNGRSSYICECPFCHNELEVYCWSKRKKCPCGALVQTNFPFNYSVKEKQND